MAGTKCAIYFASSKYAYYYVLQSVTRRRRTTTTTTTFQLLDRDARGEKSSNVGNSSALPTNFQENTEVNP